MTQQDNETSRVYVNVPMSEPFKAAFEKWCDANGYKVMARAGQKAIASLIGYDLRNEPEPKAKSKYGKDEAGEVDRMTAKLTNSFKGAEQTRLLRLSQKAKMAKDTAKVAQIDLELDAVYAADWAPALGKQLELRLAAIERLKKDKKIPSDYDDETLEELWAQVLSDDSEAEVEAELMEQLMDDSESESDSE